MVNAVGVAGGGQDSWQKVCQDTVTSPLSEDAEDDVATQAVAALPVAEKSAVVPEVLVGSVENKELFVFSKLELDPGGLGVTIAMPFGQHIDGLLAFVVDVEPSWRFWDQEDKENDETCGKLVMISKSIRDGAVSYLGRSTVAKLGFAM